MDVLVEAASSVGMPCYVNFTYLHPRGDALRSRGLPEIDETIESDRRTRTLHLALADTHGSALHGWARIWDLGRAALLFDQLGPVRAARARADLRKAVRLGKGALLDLVGLSVKGEVFFRETVIGASRAGRFGRLLRKAATGAGAPGR